MLVSAAPQVHVLSAHGFGQGWAMWLKGLAASFSVEDDCKAFG